MPAKDSDKARAVRCIRPCAPHAAPPGTLTTRPRSSPPHRAPPPQARKVDDLTFGLKNKNKSKKVQQFVDSVKTTMKAGMEAKAKAAKTPEQIEAEKFKKMKVRAGGVCAREARAGGARACGRARVRAGRGAARRTAHSPPPPPPPRRRRRRRWRRSSRRS